MDWLVETLRTLVAPGLMGLGALIAWWVRSQFEKYRELERSLASQQRETYAKILDPFIQIFAAVKGGGDQRQVMKQMIGKDYRKTTFDLSLFGSDEVVRAYNAMMQYMYTVPQDKADPAELMRHGGNMLLEIRRLGPPKNLS